MEDLNIFGAVLIFTTEVKMIRKEIIKRMEAQSLSRYELAKRLKLRQATVNDFLSGKRRIRYDFLIKLMDFFNIKINKL